MKKYIGSCLCKEISFEIDGEFEKFFFCHCGRCRKGTGSAHGANLFSRTAKFKWISGEQLVKTYGVANTRFAKSFCKNCGSAMPTIRENNSIVVPAGSLDCDIDFIPTGHIHMASKANWDHDLENVAKFEIYP
ncbi:MAG: GFA family protein [Pseudobdellovibrionaceae bacterium]